MTSPLSKVIENMGATQRKKKLAFSTSSCLFLSRIMKNKASIKRQQNALCPIPVLPPPPLPLSSSSPFRPLLPPIDLFRSRPSPSPLILLLNCFTTQQTTTVPGHRERWQWGTGFFVLACVRFPCLGKAWICVCIVSPSLWTGQDNLPTLCQN